MDEDSACLGLPTELSVALAGSNHKTICRFSSPDSQRYEPVWKAIKDLAFKIERGQTAGVFVSLFLHAYALLIF